MSSPTPPQPDAQAAQAGPGQTSQAAQIAIALALAYALSKLWPSLDLAMLKSDLPAFKAAVAQQVQKHARASATLAAQQYRQQRVAAGVGAGYTPVQAELPPLEQIFATVDWATSPLWDENVLAHAQGMTKVAEGVTTSLPSTSGTTDAGSAIAAAKARLAAASERLVLDTGRDTILANVTKDRKALGWARIPEPGACSFCLMEAIRGAVYKKNSFDRANARFTGSGTAKTHNHCRCQMEPVFSAYEPPHSVRQAEALWKSSTKNLSGKDARIAFRRAVEGRTAPDTSSTK